MFTSTLGFLNSNLTSANMSFLDKSSNPGQLGFTNSNLTQVNFTGVNLIRDTGLDSATLTGVIWSNTLCPDGTNSDNNGNTCVGHLTP